MKEKKAAEGKEEMKEEKAVEMKVEKGEETKGETKVEKKEEMKKQEGKEGSWKDSIYNPRSGEFLGRTASSWGKTGGRVDRQVLCETEWLMTDRQAVGRETD